MTMAALTHLFHNAMSYSILIALIVLLLSLLVHPSVVRRLHLLLSVTESKELTHGQFDCIIVLGYALFRDGTPTEPLKGRVEAGLRLLRDGRGPTIILSGSHTCPIEGLRCDSEANVMMRWAAGKMGVAAEDMDGDIWLKEEKSTSTRENAVYSLRLMKERLGGGARSIVIVTSPFHQLRSLWTFQRAAREVGKEDLEIFVARTEFVPHRGYGRGLGGGLGAGLVNSGIDLWDWGREILAIVYYKMKGFV